MKLVAGVVVAVAAVIAATPPAQACLWDNDTFKEEALGDKEVAQVVKGELRKHSPAFYEAKVIYTRAIVDKGDAAKERYDDLAVALAKTGKLDDAIAVLADKEKKFPGEYTTAANLGTFLAMKGDLAGALEHLKKAVAINPDAHFGREIVQIQFLEFMQKLAADPTLDERETFLGAAVGDEADLHVRTRRDKKADKAIDKQIKGIVGLIKFGDGDQNPHLWFGLARALVARGDNQLAMYAFRRAEQLGHKVAGADGAARAGVIRELITGSGDTRHLAWGKVTPVVDAAWTKSTAADAKRQATEDKKVAKRQFKSAFGY